jgi:hypothetical protein
VSIENQIATTEVDMQFTNEGHSLAEGTFIFPLPLGAAVAIKATAAPGPHRRASAPVRADGGNAPNHRAKDPRRRRDRGLGVARRRLR